MSEDDIEEFANLSKTQGATDAEEDDEGDEGEEREGEEEPDLHESTVDEPPPFKGERKVGGGKDKRAKDKRARDMHGKDRAKDNDMVSKGAMDAALKANEKLVTERVLRTQRELRDALDEVRPIVGEIKIAMDSATQVYQHVLKAKGVALPAGEDVSLGVLRSMVKMLPKSERRVEVIAMDSAAIESWAKDYPGAANIRIS
jgi:hypothetical protein